MTDNSKPTLAGSTHAISVALMLESNLGISREEAERRTDEYLRNLDRIADEVAQEAARPHIGDIVRENWSGIPGRIEDITDGVASVRYPSGRILTAHLNHLVIVATDDPPF